MAVRTAHAVIGEGGRMGSAVDGINDRRPVPTRVVLVGGRVLLRVGDGGDQTCGSVGERGGIAQRINDLRQLAFGVIVPEKNGSSGRTRTYNPPVNSRMLCH